MLQLIVMQFCRWQMPNVLQIFIFYLLNSKIDLQFRFKTRKRKSFLATCQFPLFKTNIHCVWFFLFRNFDFLKDASKKLPKRYECCGSVATCQVQTTWRIQFPVIQWIQICRSSKVQRQPVWRRSHFAVCQHWRMLLMWLPQDQRSHRRISHLDHLLWRWNYFWKASFSNAKMGSRWRRRQKTLGK